MFDAKRFFCQLAKKSLRGLFKVQRPTISQIILKISAPITSSENRIFRTLPYFLQPVHYFRFCPVMVTPFIAFLTFQNFSIHGVWL